MSTRKLARIKRQLKRAGITLQTVADAVPVSVSHVSHVLAGRFTSSRVLAAAERLLLEREAAAPGPQRPMVVLGDMKPGRRFVERVSMPDGTRRTTSGRVHG